MWKWDAEKLNQEGAPAVFRRRQQSGFETDEDPTAASSFTTSSSTSSSKQLEKEDSEEEVNLGLRMWSNNDEVAAESGCDWTVVVVTGWSENDKVETYHVHKEVLGQGPRVSTFFQKEFESSSGPENTSGADATIYSILELESPLAVAFPDLLDFIYSPPFFKHLETSCFRSLSLQRSTALRDLAERVGVRSLVESMNRVIDEGNI